MQEISFEAPLRGQFTSLSPNGCMLALVKHGISTLIYDYTPGAAESAAQKSVPKEKGKPLPHGAPKPDAPSPSLATGAVLKVQHKALDQVTGLSWSPDSTLLALLMSPRSTIEIISVVLHHPIGHAKGSSIVPSAVVTARIDGGLNGILTSTWHPSSRVLYFFGACRAHGLSLSDGTTMQLLGSGGGGVKLARRSAQRLLAMSKVRAGNDAPTGGAFDGLTTTMAATALNDGWWEGELDAAPLLQFSCCQRFIYCVTPRQLQSTTIADNKDGSSLVNASARMNESTTDGTVIDECLVVLCASTHKILHAQDLPSFTNGVIMDVASIHVTASAVVLHDLVQGNLVIASLSVNAILRVVRGEGLLSVSVSSSALTGGRTIAASSADKCIVFVAVGSGEDEVDGSAEDEAAVDPTRLRRSFHETFYTSMSFPLRQRLLSAATPILVETSGNHDAGRAPPSDADSFKENVYGAALDTQLQPPKVYYRLEENPYLVTESTLANNTAATISTTSASDRSSSTNTTTNAGGALVLGALPGPVPNPLAGGGSALACFQLLSVSPMGRFIAVVPPHHPHCVAIVDVFGGAIHSVLKHSAVVVHCAWAPQASLPSRARPRRAENGSASSVSQRSDLLEREADREAAAENLALSTDSHDGIIFFWRSDSAMAAAVPPIVIRSGEPAHRPQSHGQGVVTLKGVEVGMRVNRILWSPARPAAYSTSPSLLKSLVLCDDLRGTCVSASMD